MPTACEAAEISSSAYYDWLAREGCRPDLTAELDEAHLINHIHDIHAESDSTYGSPRMTEELRAAATASTTSGPSGSCGTTTW